jgi:hypothetical protein
MNEPTERRSSPRHRFACRARFREPDALPSGAERRCVTRDFSRDGVYFIAEDRGLRENMKLLLRFPELLATVQDREYLIEILRMNRLPEDRCGIGARLILRRMVRELECIAVPGVDLTRHGCLYEVSRRVDLYV